MGAVLVERLTKYLLMMECKRCGELVFPHESDAIDGAIIMRNRLLVVTLPGGAADDTPGSPKKPAQ